MHGSRQLIGDEQTYTEGLFACVEVVGSGCLGVSHDGDQVAGFTIAHVDFAALQACFVQEAKVLLFVSSGQYFRILVSQRSSPAVFELLEETLSCRKLQVGKLRDFSIQYRIFLKPKGPTKAGSGVSAAGQR